MLNDHQTIHSVKLRSELSPSKKHEQPNINY